MRLQLVSVVVLAAVGAGACKAADKRQTGGKGGEPSSSARITVDDNGFTPSSISLKKGDKGELTFTRTSDDTCAKDVVFPDLNVKKDLPLREPVTILVPTDKDRTFKFTCGMGMYESSVVIH